MSLKRIDNCHLRLMNKLLHNYSRYIIDEIECNAHMFKLEFMIIYLTTDLALFHSSFRLLYLMLPLRYDGPMRSS